MKYFKQILHRVNSTGTMWVFGSGIAQLCVGNYRTSAYLLLCVALLLCIEHFVNC